MTNVATISIQEFSILRQTQTHFFLLDVRNPDEYAVNNLGGYLIPLNELPDRISELNPNDFIIIHCHSGLRSHRAAEFLIQHGFTQVRNLQGGMVAWEEQLHPNFKNDQASQQ